MSSKAISGGSRRELPAEKMGRKKEKDGGGTGNVRHETPLYSREDIREQYCINSQGLDGLERGSRRTKGFFGCLASRKVRPNQYSPYSFFFYFYFPDLLLFLFLLDFISLFFKLIFYF